MNKCRYFLLLLVPIALAACVHPKALVYKDVEDLQVRLLKQPPITVYVRFYNPNTYPLRFRDGMVTVAVDNIAVGTMTVDTAFTAPPLAAFSVPLELHADLRKVLPSASKLIFEDSVFVQLHGYIRAG
jgi:LEA14-like dessication related protein